MELRRLDDFQSWLVEAGGRRMAIDPWLTGEIVVGRPWLFRRRHRSAPAFTPETLPPLDALLVSAPFEDHLVPETLRALDPRTPVIASPAACPAVTKLGFRDVRLLAPGERAAIDDALVLTAVRPGFPYRKASIGVVLEAPGSDARAYLETHVTDLAGLAPWRDRLDAVVAPTESVRLAGIQYSMGPARVLRNLVRLRPRCFVPTGDAPSAATGLLPRLLVYSGSPDELARRVAQAGLPTRVVALASGESLRLGSAASPAARVA